MHKMYLKKCLQSIGLCVDCGSGQFIHYLLHSHGLMVLSDDGLVQVAWIQTYLTSPFGFLRKVTEETHGVGSTCSMMISSSIR